MAGMELDFFPTTVLRVDAIGKPGERVFYIQGGDKERMVTLVLEKFQLQALVVGVEQLLAELDTRFPALAQSEGDYSEEQMRITGAYDTFFRVGEINLGYDAPADKVALTLESIRLEDKDGLEEPDRVRFWCERAQMAALAKWARVVISQGRPTWPSDNQPIQPPDKFSPRHNGHKH